jgi:DNA transformation protein
MPDEALLARLCETLKELPDLTTLPAYGGHAISSRGKLFGILVQGRVYLRTDEGTRPIYQKAGSAPLRHLGMKSLENFYEVPAMVMQNPVALLAWSRQALATSESGARRG